VVGLALEHEVGTPLGAFLVVGCDEILVVADVCDLVVEFDDAALVQHAADAVTEYPYYHEYVRTFPSLILESVDAHDVVH